MKKLSLFLLATLFALGCSQKGDSTDSFDITKSKGPEAKMVKASERIDLENKGVGPISEVILAEAIDEKLARTGEGLYKTYCTICHKVDAKFIGPAPKGILERRTPEWIMNMILAPERMLRDDPLAKQLFIEFNGSPMANQGLSEEEARAVLEFFRTLE